MLRTAFSRASAAVVAAPAVAGACLQVRAFADAPSVSVSSFEKTEGDAIRASVSKMFKDIGMEVPPAIAGGKPVGELMESVNDAFMRELDLPEGKMKEAMAMRSKIKEAFAKQESDIVPKFVDINWDGYKAALGDPVLVDKFKDAMEKTLADPALANPVQPAGGDPLMDTVAEAEKSMEELANAVAEDLKASAAQLVKLQARSKEIEAEMEAIESGKVTLDSELARYPELAAKIDAEILDDKW